jgi:Fic family protein
MKRTIQGEYVLTTTSGEKVKAFVPFPLPPAPPINWGAHLHEKFDQALIALGRLDSLTLLLPDTSLFIYMYIRKEAVLSSMIEGTQSSLSDLLLFELEQQPGVPLDDVQEVSNYVKALYYGLQRLEEGFPISLRLMREIHEVLLSKGRGSHQMPGEFRRSQNWIGGSRPGNAVFVPPPPDKVMECMGQLELFINDQPQPTPILLKAALAHVQFETIHPFLDGNGRLGRLLITLLLCEKQVLKKPMLYLSLYFKQNRQMYYDLLDRVRSTGDWEAWLEFFADAVSHTASQAVETARKLVDMAGEDRDKILTLGRASVSTVQVHHFFMQTPISTSNRIVEATRLTAATVNKALGHLVSLGILKELGNQKRNRLFSYARYINAVNDGIKID